MGYIGVITGIYWGYNLVTNLLLTYWDILVPFPTKNANSLPSETIQINDVKHDSQMIPGI